MAQAWLFEAFLGLLERLAERSRTVLVVEDLHWADRSTLDLLAFLVRNLRAGLLLVLTYRTDELHRQHPLRPFLAGLDRSGRVQRLDLGRFDRAGVADLLTGILGTRPDDELVERIFLRSEGNAFFAEELLAVAHHGDGRSLPPSLENVLLSRAPDPSRGHPGDTSDRGRGQRPGRAGAARRGQRAVRSGPSRRVARRGRPPGARPRPRHRDLRLPARADPGGAVRRAAAGRAGPAARRLRPRAHPAHRSSPDPTGPPSRRCSRTTGAGPTTRPARCRPRWRRACSPRRPTGSPTRRGTSRPRSRCGTRSPIPEPDWASIVSRCCSTPPSRPTWPATRTAPSP